ncbi:Serine/threonine-protein kinase pkn3 [Saguinus oedipus]|uniref:Serine/threonine-protein kinase pkn3 n=1 Tax=Saguinus oedipus TaxID=9490 RepID=A0ABQ9WFG9_SAGOE|nr:Serine/threonine-protein kinase pkn3 [Saguinus oedipus]
MGLREGALFPPPSPRLEDLGAGDAPPERPSWACGAVTPGGNRCRRGPGAMAGIPRNVGSEGAAGARDLGRGVRGAGPVRTGGGAAGLGRGRPIPRLRRHFPGSFKFESPGGGAAASGTGVAERKARSVPSGAMEEGAPRQVNRTRGPRLPPRRPKPRPRPPPCPCPCPTPRRPRRADLSPGRDRKGGHCVHAWHWRESLPEHTRREGSGLPRAGAGTFEYTAEVIRRAIQKELKIKEGVENLRRVATDRRHLGHVQQLLRSSNRRLEQLHGELRELHARILLPDPGPGLAEPVASGSRPWAEQLRAQHLEALRRQLQVELKVKQGAENMTHTCASGTPKERKLLAAAQQMLRDSQLKVALLRMKISSLEASGSPEPGPELLADELQHRVHVEAAVAEGAKNVVKLLGSRRTQDRKALAEAQAQLQESSQKLDLLRLALEQLLERLPPAHPLRSRVARDLRTAVPGYPQPSGTPVKPTALTGTLQVRLLGCEQLLTTVPGRSPVAALAGSPSEGWLRTRAKQQRGRGELASEVLAVLKVDNRVVGQTGWGQVAEQSWNQTFIIPLERVRPAFVWSGVPLGCGAEGCPGRDWSCTPPFSLPSPIQARELEIGVHWRDWRQLCGVAFLRLEDFLDNACHQLSLSLVPQGLLFAQVLTASAL